MESITESSANPHETGIGGVDSPLGRVVLVSERVWRSIDEVLRVKRKFQRGVVRLGLAGTVVGPKALLSRRTSPDNVLVSVLVLAP